MLSNVDIAMLKELEQKILWLSSWTIHNANHIRESRDGAEGGWPSGLLRVLGHTADRAFTCTHCGPKTGSL